MEIRIRVCRSGGQEGEETESIFHFMGSKWGHYLRTKNTMEKQLRSPDITMCWHLVGIEEMEEDEGEENL